MKSGRFLRLAALCASAMAIGAVFAAPSSAQNQFVTGLTTGNNLVFFCACAPQSASAPDTINFPPAATDTNLVGIDYRPRGGDLYGVASQGTVYILRPDPAPATTTTAIQVNPSGPTPFTGTSFGVDFNPVPDAIRVVNDNEENARINPNNGALTNDTALTPAGNVVGAAYTNSFQGATQTTLFGIDSAADTLVRQGSENGTPNSPNGGAITTIGPLGVNTTADAGFDIDAELGGGSVVNNAFAALTPAATPTATRLYEVNLATGAATPTGTGPIPGGAALEGIAVQPNTTLRFANAATQVSEGQSPAVITVSRSGTGLARQATVNYSTSITSSDNASQADFTATSGTLTFPPGVSTASFTVPVTNDTADEPDESFQVNLSQPSSSAQIGVVLAKVVIVDDDSPAAVKGKPGKAPTGLLSVASQTAKAAYKQGVKGRYSCDEACNATLTLKLGGRKLGTAKSSLADSGSKAFKVRINAAGKRAVANNPLQKLTIIGRFADGDGGRTTQLKFRLD